MEIERRNLKISYTSLASKEMKFMKRQRKRLLILKRKREKNLKLKLKE
jgi:hypothetical protein